MTTRLYVVRHAETTWNAEGRMQGWHDAPLTARGWAQAEAVARRLAEVPLASCYSSSSQRALATAAIILEGRGIPVQGLDTLREIGLGGWEGRLLADVRRDPGPDALHFWAAPHLYRPNGLESFTDVQRRVVQAVQQIVREHPGADVLLVSHTVAIRVLLAWCDGRPLERLWEKPAIHPASLSVFELSDGGCRVVLAGDVSHLEEEAGPRTRAGQEGAH
jgi:phosphoserine phosphatase